MDLIGRASFIYRSSEAGRLLKLTVGCLQLSCGWVSITGNKAASNSLLIVNWFVSILFSVITILNVIDIFLFQVLYDIGVVSTKEPFQCVINQGLILGEVSVVSYA